jgi:hypothetical protein
MWDRHADEAAIGRVVANQGQQPAAVATVQPRTNTSAGPAPRATLTGSQLLAQRRANTSRT